MNLALLFLFLQNAIAPCLHFLSGFGAKVFTGPIKDLTGTAKDLSGLKRDHVETKLAERKLLEQQSRIYQVGFADVQQFDPRYQLLAQKVQADVRAQVYAAARKNLLLIFALILFGSLVVNNHGAPPFWHAFSCLCTILGIVPLLLPLQSRRRIISSGR